MTKPRSLTLVAGTVFLLAGCGGGSRAYRVPEVERAFAAHSLAVASIDPPLDLFGKDVRAALSPVRTDSGEVAVVVFASEKAAKAYDRPGLAAVSTIKIGRARNVVVTYEHVSPATAQRIRQTLRALR